MSIGGRSGLIAFVGPAVVRSAVLLWLFALAFFLLELLFAFLFQRFLVILGLLSMPDLVFGSIRLTLTQVVLLLLAASVMRMGVAFVLIVAAGRNVERFAHGLRRDLIDERLDARSINSAETLSFFNQRIYTASMALHAAQVLAWQGTVVLGLFVALMVISPLLTMTMAVFVAVIAVLPIRALNRRLKRSATLQADTFERILQHLGNLFRNFLLIRLYNLQSSEKQRIHGDLSRYRDLIFRYQRMNGISAVVGPFLIGLSILGIALAQHTAAALPAALTIPYLYLFVRLAQGMVPIVNETARLIFASQEFRTARQWRLARNEAPSPTASRDAMEPVQEAIGWRLSDVTFGYPGQTPLFDRFSLNIAPGALLRVHGDSGAGKSTLISLLLGEATPKAGTITALLDGREVPIPQAAERLRTHIGYSSSETFLFAGSIEDNVTYGLRQRPDDPFFRDCVARAECQFILELPRQFQHEIDELGQGLSSGQKQRLSLLRALLRRPKVLILDEALSNVDLPTERRILASLVSGKQDCTVVYVSHRGHDGLVPDANLELSARE